MMKVDEFVTCFELEVKDFADGLDVRVRRKDKSTLPFKKVAGWWCHLLLQGRIREENFRDVRIKDYSFGMLIGDNV